MQSNVTSVDVVYMDKNTNTTVFGCCLLGSDYEAGQNTKVIL